MKDFVEVEGKLTFLEYITPETTTATQVFRTYQTQLQKSGFTILYSCRTGDCGDMPMHFVREYVEGSSTAMGNAMVAQKGSVLVASGTLEGKRFVVTLVVGDDNRAKAARYTLNIVEQEALDTEKVTAASDTEAR